MSIIISDSATIHTTVCGIYRWPSKIMEVKSGPYYSIIAAMDVMRLLDMSDFPGRPYYSVHAVAVVDDFGNLVGVPA